MEIKTRDFGQVDINPEDIVTFELPIYGFEQLSKYVFLFEEDNSHIVWLQSVENPEICFIMLDANYIDLNYSSNINLSREARHILGKGDYSYWLIMVVADDFTKSTVNMKSPVVLNPTGHKAIQVILEEDYPIRYPLTRAEGAVQEC